MKVLKFGGTSVGNPERMKKVARLSLKEGALKVVVLSAVSGTTNTLVGIGEKLRVGEKGTAKKQIDQLAAHYDTFIQTLYTSDEGLSKARAILHTHFEIMTDLVAQPFDVAAEKVLLAQGELLSTQLFFQYLVEEGINAALLPALDFMSIDKNGEPEISKIGERLQKMLKAHDGIDLFVTQGYICRNHLHEVDNLKRGGSDYTASLIGAALSAEEIQIWTDIDGMHNNDPRVVENTFPLAKLTFDEAAELAYFGAKILHPSSILPAQKYMVPVKLLSTMNEEAPGTIISAEASVGTIKALAAKDGITAIKIKSTRMLLAHGFLRKVFEVFEKYQTPIDMITTSEVAVSLTIDEDTHLQKIMGELAHFGIVEVDTTQTIICIVGSMIAEKKGVLKRVFDALKDIPVRMVSFGGSKNNISILVDTNYKNLTLNNLNKGLFEQALAYNNRS